MFTFILSFSVNDITYNGNECSSNHCNQQYDNKDNNNNDHNINWNTSCMKTYLKTSIKTITKNCSGK